MRIDNVVVVVLSIQWQGLLIILFQNFQQLECLKCHECTDLRPSELYSSDCARRSPKSGSLKEGFAGCLKVDVKSETAAKFVIRAGFNNEQMKGRPLSCYFPPWMDPIPTFEVHPEISKLKFVTLDSCLVCNDQDGCNGVSSIRLRPQNFIFIILNLLLINYVL